MSVNAQPRMVNSLSSGIGEPFYFGSGGHKLFGWLHQPTDQNVRATGLVICNPFGYEAICAHKSVRAFAEASAIIGVPALRFDYFGTGDSGDIDPKANQLDVWSSDVIAAVDELRRRTGVERVCLLGIRLGGLLAVLAAMRCRSIDGMILISPILSGRRYLRDIRTTRLAASLSAGAAELPDVLSNDQHATIDGSLEVSGFMLSATTLAALANVDLTTLDTPPVSEILIIDGSTMPVARRWAGALAATPISTRYLALPGLIEMIMTMPHYAKPPEAMVAAMRDWLQRVPPISSASAEGGPRPQPVSDANSSAAVLELPDDKSGQDALVTEHPVLLSSDHAIFGILTEPRSGEIRRRAVILLNAGATHHIGPNRIYVSLARRWARQGYFVLRLDLESLGDSGAGPGHPDNQVFPPAALEDIRVAIEFLRTHHRIEDLTICGFCSGAYHAFRAAAAALRVNRILLVNLEEFFWQAGTDIDALNTAEVVRRTRNHRDRIISIDAWKRLITGQINIWRLLQVYIQRPLLTVESTFRDFVRRLHIRLPRDVGSELEEIAARGVRIVFVFARGEAGIDLLRIKGGSSLKRLADRCRVHIIDHADHVFSQPGPRRVLEEILSNELFAQTNNRQIRATALSGMESKQAPSSSANVLSVPNADRQAGSGNSLR